MSKTLTSPRALFPRNQNIRQIGSPETCPTVAGVRIPATLLLACRRRRETGTERGGLGCHPPEFPPSMTAKRSG